MIGRLRPNIITSKMLILQSKRLMLCSLERRLADSGPEALRERAKALALECEDAQHKYRSAVLAYGTPQTADYWVIAYSRLIEMGQTLAVKLREATGELPLAERYQVAADVEMLEDIVGSWSGSLRDAMASAAVA